VNFLEKHQNYLDDEAEAMQIDTQSMTPNYIKIQNTIQAKTKTQSTRNASRAQEVNFLVRHKF
jgi:hypothetical protein